VRSSPAVSAAIVGLREPAHVEEALALARVPPAPPEAIEALFKRASEAEPGAG
jgi:aryl-alcohol dehydrogenase-like predicted oxidoreductase